MKNTVYVIVEWINRFISFQEKTHEQPLLFDRVY